MARTLTKLVKWLYLLAAVVIILLAVSVQLGRSYSPLLSKYNESLSRYLSAQLKAQVTIGSISADWSGLKPSVEISDFRILSQANEPIVSFKEASMRFDILGSLRHGRLVWSNLLLQQVDMDFVQSAQGHWRVQGLPESKPEKDDTQTVDLGALMDMLLLSTRIEFQHTRLNFHFYSLTHEAIRPSVTFDSPYLLLENTNDFHRLALQVDVDNKPRSIFLVAEGEGDPRNTKEFRSRGFLQLNQFPTSEPITAASEFLLGKAAGSKTTGSNAQSEGSVDASIWFTGREGGEGYDLMGQLALQRLSLQLGESKWQLDNFSTQLIGYWLTSGKWQLGTQNITAAAGERQITDLNVAVASQGINQPLELRLDQLDLTRIDELLTNAGVQKNEKLKELLQALNLRGYLRNLQLSLPTDNPKNWQLSANLDQLAVDAHHGIPGLVGVDGYVTTNANKGFIELDSKRFFSMYYANTYAKPMEYENAKGQIAWHWQSDKNRFAINSGRLEFRNKEEQAHGYMSLTMPIKRNTGDIDLTIQVHGKNLAAGLYQKYTPMIAPKSLLSWLDQSVGADNLGQAKEAKFIFRGTLNSRNPKSRTFQLYLDLVGAELQYHPGWPKLSNLTGQLFVNDNQVAATINSAQLYDSRVLQGQIRVNPLPQGQGSLLNITGEIRGSASDGLRVLREGQLRQYLGKNLDSWSAQGSLRTLVDLDIPLINSDQLTNNNISVKPRQAIQVDLTNTQLKLNNLNLDVTELNGKLSYSSEDGLTSEPLQGILFAEPVIAQLKTERKSDVHKTLIDIQGAIATKDLIAWSQRPETQFLTGRMNYKAQVELNHLASVQKQNDNISIPDTAPTEHFLHKAFANIRVTTNLENVAVDLPVPYGKTAKETRPLSFTYSLQDAQAQVQVNYNKNVDVVLRLDRLQRNQLTHANVALASQARLSNPNEFLISGFLPEIDLDAWKKTQTDYQTYTKQWALLKKEESASAPLDFRAELLLGRYQLGALTLDNLNLTAKPTLDGWNIAIQNSLVTGQLQLPNETNPNPLKISLSRLALSKDMFAKNAEPVPSEPVASEFVDPRKFPRADIEIDSFFWQGENYGNWSMQIKPNTDGVLIDNIKGQIRGMTVGAAKNKSQVTDSNASEDIKGAQLLWQNTDAGVQSRFIGKLTASDIAGVLREWKKPDTVESTKAEYNMDVYWFGAPQQFSLINLYGDMDIYMEKGRFKRDASAGEGILKLLSILNFDSLARRMRLDFSDLYQSGLAYDDINGKVKFNDGTLMFEQPLVVKTPSSRLQMAGTVDLRGEKIDSRLVATLPVAGNLTFFAALATGLPAAAGIYVVSKLFAKQVDQATSISYTIKGNWDDPKMRFDRLFESEESLRESVNKNP